MPEMRDWRTDPALEDGSEINVKFPQTAAQTKARWNIHTKLWEVRLSNGDWIGMWFERQNEPDVWWP